MARLPILLPKKKVETMIYLMIQYIYYHDNVNNVCDNFVDLSDYFSRFDFKNDFCFNSYIESINGFIKNDLNIGGNN